MKIQDDLAYLIAGFYAEMYGEKLPVRNYTADMEKLVSRLQQRAFPSYRFDPEQFKAQAKAQLRGNRKALHNYHYLDFRFAPVSGEGGPLAVHMGATSSPTEPNGTLTIWAEDPAINERIQSVLNGEGETQ